MTKVEKLREEIDDTLEDVANSLSPSRHKDFIGLDDVLDSLIAAAREEGRAEERERIRKESLHYAEGEPLEGTDAESVEGDEAIAQQEMFIIPASVLAPTESATEEADNDNS